MPIMTLVLSSFAATAASKSIRERMSVRTSGSRAARPTSRSRRLGARWIGADRDPQEPLGIGLARHHRVDIGQPGPVSLDPGGRQLVPDADVPELHDVARHRPEPRVTEQVPAQMRAPSGLRRRRPRVNSEQICEQRRADDLDHLVEIGLRLPGAAQLEQCEGGGLRRIGEEVPHHRRAHAGTGAGAFAISKVGAAASPLPSGIGLWISRSIL